MKKEIRIDEKIYDLGKIKQAISDFSEIADISYNEDLLCIQGENENEIEQTFKEFMNYVLSI